MAENVKDSPSPPWIELPRDLTANILQRLGSEDILESAQKVCRIWRKVCLEPTMWRVVDLEYSNRYKFKKYYSMCRCAVDRSQGQLIELTISCFGDNELLDYIVDRASNLKCLTLRGCINLDGDRLTQAIKKLPYLEELHLAKMMCFRSDICEIGRNCPKLRSFSYSAFSSMFEAFKSSCALEISQSMPNLRHLRYGTEEISTKELELILDGCPHLKSLDLMVSYSHNLRKDLPKRCLKQIKGRRINFCLDERRTGSTTWLGYSPFD